MTAPKLSDLTEHDKIRLAAELDGWRFDTGVYVCGEQGIINAIRPDGESMWEFASTKIERVLRCVPDYNTSYDAIIPPIQKQDYGVQEAIWTSTKNIWWGLTPSQLLDALLVATGKATI